MLKSIKNLFKKKEVKVLKAGSVTLNQAEWEMVMNALENDYLYAVKTKKNEVIFAIESLFVQIEKQLK